LGRQKNLGYLWMGSTVETAAERLVGVSAREAKGNREFGAGLSGFLAEIAEKTQRAQRGRAVVECGGLPRL